MESGFIEVEYYCPGCDKKYGIHHSDDRRDGYCAWCGNKVELTGHIECLEGDSIVAYDHGKEVSRRPRKQMNRAKA